MVNPFAFVAFLPPLFETTTFHFPDDFPLSGNLHVILVADLNDTLVPVIAVCPLFVICTDAPALKFVPVIVVAIVPVFTPVAGVILVIVGAGFPTT